jgi:argininosuccinate lyase
MKEGKTLEELSLEEYRAFHPAFDEGLYAEIDLDACVKKRISEGGTGPDSVNKQIRTVQEKLK